MQGNEDDIQRAIAEYSNRLNLLNQQVDRLNTLLRSKLEQISALDSKNRLLIQEIEGLKRGNSEGQFKISQITQQFQSKVTIFEGRIRQFTQENDELKRRLQ